MRTVVGLFDDVDIARKVVSELIEKGFDRDDISLVARQYETDNIVEVDLDTADDTAEGAALGAVSGGVVGGLTGLLVGAGALAIPGIGPIVAAGPIITALTGAGIGAATGGVLGALVGLGIPEDDVEYYAEGIRRGGTLVAVKTDENWVERATEIMNRHNPVDVESRSIYWRETGWDGFDADADVYSRTDYEKEVNRYRTYDNDFYIYSPTFRRHFQSNYADAGYAYIDYEPVYYLGYRLATEDRYRDYDDWDGLEAEAREEWNQFEHKLGRAWEDVKDTVRHAWETVTEPFDGDDDSYVNGRNGNYTTNGYSKYAADFRDHYNMTYAGSGYFFDHYEPGYRYGYYLATDDNYRDYSEWDALKMKARQEWEETEDAAEATWDDIKDAARHAWEVVTEPFDEDDDSYGHTY